MSRILGLIRDSLIAHFIGAGLISDAFYTAFRIPNMLRDLLGEGSLSSIIVSRLGQVKEKKGKKAVKNLIQRLFGFWAVILCLISLLGMLFAPYLVQMMAWGFSDKVVLYQLTVDLTRKMFPFIGMVGLSALTMAVLHHHKIFGWSSAASSFLNLTIICISCYCYFSFNPSPESMVHYLVYAFLIGSVVQWVSMWPGLIKSKINFWPQNPFSFLWHDSEVNKVFLMLGPSILGVAAVQINVLVNHNYATFLSEGTVTHIYYSFRIMQLPVGIVGVAVSTVLLPKLSEYFSKNNTNAFSNEISTAITKVSFLTIPAIAGLSLVGDQLIIALYEHGKFSTQASSGVWLALQGYLIGILPYVFNKNLIQAFYARNDIKFPVLVSLISVLLNAGINYSLAFHFGMGAYGLTMGTSIVLAINTVALILGLKVKHQCTLNYKKIGLQLFLISIATIFMCITVVMIQSRINLNHQVFQLILETVAGLISYFAFTFILKKLKR